PVLRVDAVVDKGALDGFRQLGERAEIGIVAFALPGEKGEQRVVKIIAPLGIDLIAARLASGDNAGIVQVTLGNEDFAAAEHGLERASLDGELLQEMNGGAVNEGVHCVEAEA